MFQLRTIDLNVAPYIHIINFPLQFCTEQIMDQLKNNNSNNIVHKG